MGEANLEVKTQNEQKVDRSGVKVYCPQHNAAPLPYDGNVGGWTCGECHKSYHGPTKAQLAEGAAWYGARRPGESCCPFA